MAIIWRQRELDQLEAMAGDLPRIELFRYYRGQAHAAGLTTCRRLALQMVLGLAAERDDDFNAGAETQPRQARPQGGPSGQQGQQQPTRTVTTGRQQAGGAARQAPTRQGPPPGWLSKEQRLALEQEMMDPAITPERFQEIEAKLLAAAAAPSPQQQKPVMSHTLSVPARGP